MRYTGDMRRRELFPADPGLTARMLLAAVLTPALVLAALAAVVLVAPLKIIIVVAIAAVVGTVAAVRERNATSHARELKPTERPEVHEIVARLCLIADLPKPRIVLAPETQPNSWIVSTGRGRTRLHLTRGLLERLEPRELEAVIGHELAHVAHRDAAVMTAVGGPGAVLLSGGLRVLRGGWFMWFGGAVAAAIGGLAMLGTRALSRYREFAADAGSVTLTGNPAALASALTKVSDGIVAIPARDLRAVAARDAFHLLPVSRDGEGPLRLPPSHPRLKARIERLQRMERQLQSSRPAPKVD
jgi:heat shock protein HtpX